MPDNPFLKRAYQLNNQQETMSMYSDWADSYDQTMQESDYQSPRRIAEALSRYSQDKSLPIFDVGCGTGLSGVALFDAGFTTIDGSDISKEMLAVARERKSIYRTLTLVKPENPFPLVDNVYNYITAMGVIADKHAPPEMISMLLNKLQKDGLLLFSLNNHTLKNPSYMNTCKEAVHNGSAEILESKTGPHMVKLGMTSRIIVMRKIK